MGGPRPGKEWVGPGVGKIRAITCLGGVCFTRVGSCSYPPAQELAGETGREGLK